MLLLMPYLPMHSYGTDCGYDGSFFSSCAGAATLGGLIVLGFGAIVFAWIWFAD